MSFNRNVIATFSSIKHDMSTVKEALSKNREDLFSTQEQIRDWIRYFDLRQRELRVELKEMKEKIKEIEAEKYA